MEQVKQLEKQILELQLKFKKQESTLSKSSGISNFFNNLLIVILLSTASYLALSTNPVLIALFNSLAYVLAQFIIWLRNRLSKK